MKKKILITTICAALLLIFIPVLTACKSDIEKKAKKLSTYNITAQFDDANMTLSGEENLNYVNSSEEPVNVLYFQLYGNAYRKDAEFHPVASYNIAKAYPNGLSYGNMNVTAVKSGAKDIQFSIGGEDENILVVNLEKEVFPLESVNLTIAFNLKLANVRHRLGYTENTVNMGNWYPIVCGQYNGEYILDPYYSNGDPFFSEMANYNVKLELSKEYKAAFTGNITKTTTSENSVTYEVSASVVRDFAMAFSKKFETAKQKVGNTTITYYYYDDTNPQLALEYAVNAIKTFGELFGAYPYSTFSVVKTDFLYGGMEYPTLVFIADDANDSFNEIIVHETAHQWWYGIVGNNQIKEAWIDEGLSEYSTALFYYKNPQYNKTMESFVEDAMNSYKLYVNIYMQVIKNADTSMNRMLHEYKTEYEYTTMVYNKSLIMFDEIRKSAGTEKFIKALKKIYEDNKYGETSETNIKNIFAATINADIPSVMDSFILGKAII